MTEDDLTRTLRDLPAGDLPPGALARLDRTMRDAARAAGRERGWWARGVPRWQALVACLAISTVVGLLARGTAPPVRSAPIAGSEATGSVTAPLEPRRASPSRAPRRRLATDISRWTVLEIEDGDPELGT